MDLKALVSNLQQGCRAQPGSIGLPESEDPRILTASCRLITEGLVSRVKLYGDSAEINRIAQEHGLKFEEIQDKLQLDDCPIQDCINRAADDLRAGKLDAVLAGAVATTSQVIRSAIRRVGVADGIKTISGSFLMGKVGSRCLLFADAGVVPRPTPEQLTDIAEESLKTWRRLPIDEPPRLAFLSFSTKGSAQHEEVERVRKGMELFRDRMDDVVIDGELQLDAALDVNVGRRKAPNSPVAGRANILIFPDLHAGNIGYKLAERLGGYTAIGPILQGVAKPISDLSRGCTVDDIVINGMVNLARSQGVASN